MAESGKNCITIIDPTNGRKIRSFGQRGSGQVQFNRPLGVAVTQDGHIVVSEFNNHRLQVLTAQWFLRIIVGISLSLDSVHYRVHLALHLH